ncbi:hypothetical protein JOC33_000128 [Thalassobacillus pellis]|nr:hypothetical protein [Thalassobacillus pellis]
MEVVQVWMFPDLNLWVASAVILPLIAFILKGGFRSIVGICFLGVVLPSFLVLTIYFPLQYAHFGNLLPVGGFTIKEMVISTRNMVLSYLRFELTLFYYGFIKMAERSQKWAHLGNAVTIFTYLALSIISFAYFPASYIKNAEWATLIMWKIVEFPFLERFEYIGVTTWMMVIMPILCLFLWAASRNMKHLFPHLQQKTALYMGLLLMFLAVGFIQTRSQISLLNSITSQFGIFFLGSYIPLLYILTLRRRK